MWKVAFEISDNSIQASSSCAGASVVCMWRCVEHLAFWVYRGAGALVLRPFLGNYSWVLFRCSVSEAHHLVCRCCIIKQHCDVICDVSAADALVM